MGAKKGCAFYHGRRGGYRKGRNITNREQTNIQVSYLFVHVLNYIIVGVGLYRAIGGVDKKTYAVELEFFDEVVPQVKIND